MIIWILARNRNSPTRKIKEGTISYCSKIHWELYVKLGSIFTEDGFIMFKKSIFLKKWYNLPSSSDKQIWLNVCDEASDLLLNQFRSHNIFSATMKVDASIERICHSTVWARFGDVEKIELKHYFLVLSQFLLETLCRRSHDSRKP